MIVRLTFLALSFLSINLFAQISGVEKRLPHSLVLSYDQETLTYRKASVDTFHLLAVMVDFAIDKDEATYGNGKFGSHYSKDYGKSIIDPLPHDREYFKTHLQFLKNYYHKISDGKIIIEYEVLDKIISLPKVMSEYSPPPKSNVLTKLGYFFEEVWKRVDSLYANQDFTKYDVFTIFHAGVGRDIVIPETFGLEKDIPSVYLNPATLRNFFGSNYQGVKIGNPPKYVLNSMIIPETESREIQTLTGKTLLELSINGLLAASFGSFLGLPDLFDTKTGKTAIGRFGLMDGQAMFAYAGLFPPEPSAWEKIFLGLVEPIELSKDTLNVEVFTRLASFNNQKTIYKIPINAREYYLIENRQKDALKDGIKIKSRVGANLIEYNFSKDDRRFSSYYIDTVDGVVIDVDEFDWAVPGNGLVIWHIDEKIIAENFTSNSINANPKLKGIRVIEADGIQDIGNEFRTIFGDVVVGEGDTVDFWFKNNPSRFYRNEFSDETRPRTLSNNGSPSLVKIYDFSGLSNKMTFSVQFGNNEIIPLVYERIAPSLKTEFIHINDFDTNKVYILDNRNFYSYDLKTKQKRYFSKVVDGNVVSIPISEKVVYAFCEKISGALFNTLRLKLVHVFKDSITVTTINLASNETVKNIFAYAYPRATNFSGFTSENEKKEIFYSIVILTENKLYVYNFVNNSVDVNDLPSSEVGIISLVGFIDFVTLTNKSIYFGNNKFSHSLANPFKMILVGDNSLGKPDEKFNAVIFDRNGSVEVYNKNGLISKFTFQVNDTNYYVAAGNLKGDGNNYILVNSGDKIIARNLTGAMADYFPIYSPLNTKFVGNLTLIDFNNDGADDILVMTEDGKLICYDGKTAHLNHNRPLLSYSLGYATSGVHFVYNHNDQRTYLLSGNDSGYVQLVQIASVSKNISWIMKEGDLSGRNLVYVPNQEPPAQIEFFPKSKVYNWPNPVYDNETFFRVYVAEDAQIIIKIYDLSGAFVDEIKSTVVGKLDNDIKWNVTNIQSGIYLARVEAKSLISAKSDFKIIKVAIVK